MGIISIAEWINNTRTLNFASNGTCSFDSPKPKHYRSMTLSINSSLSPPPENCVLKSAPAETAATNKTFNRLNLSSTENQNTLYCIQLLVNLANMYKYATVSMYSTGRVRRLEPEGSLWDQHVVYATAQQELCCELGSFCLPQELISIFKSLDESDKAEGTNP